MQLLLKQPNDNKLIASFKMNRLFGYLQGQRAVIIASI